MNRYNADERCPKCGCTGIKNEYKVKGTKEQVIYFSEGYPQLGISIAEQDHIKRTCLNCGYYWEELPLDKETEMGTMKVELKNNVFTATQWFKDGDHPAVYSGNDGNILDSEHGDCGRDWHGKNYYIVKPGDVIVEMPDGIHLYGYEEFRELFVNSWE